jgi:hypothetical protein
VHSRVFFFSLEISEISAETGYSVTCREKTVTEKKNLGAFTGFMLKIRIYSLVMCVTVCIAFEVWMLVAFNAHRKCLFNRGNGLVKEKMHPGLTLT